MENKYYTPDLEEFYVGFEYEYNNGIVWTPMTFSFDVLRLFPESPLKNEVRVKYLDKEDIESLGFNFISSHIAVITKTEIFFFYKESSHAYINYTPEYNEVTISFQDKDSLSSETLFSGKIKNKSELSRILKNNLGV